MGWNVQTVPGDGTELNQDNTLFILTGDNTQFALWKGSTDAVFAEGNHQTIIEEYAVPNFIYDFGRNLNIQFYPDNAQPLTVYGFFEASGAHVTLSAGLGQTATETPYSQGFAWGTKLTVDTAALGTTNTAFFPGVAHVALVAGS